MVQNGHFSTLQLRGMKHSRNLSLIQTAVVKKILPDNFLLFFSLNTEIPESKGQVVNQQLQHHVISLYAIKPVLLLLILYILAAH